MSGLWRKGVIVVNSDALNELYTSFYSLISIQSMKNGSQSAAYCLGMSCTNFLIPPPLLLVYFHSDVMLT